MTDWIGGPSHCLSANHYGFRRGYAPAARRGGADTLAGLEFAAHARFALNAELQLHVMDGPTEGPLPARRDGKVFGSTVLALRAALGRLKLRF